MTSPTLDDTRIDEIRTHLTRLAAADLAADRPHRTHPGRRRMALAATTAVVLGAVLVAVTSVVGGPGPIDGNAAVAVEQSDGWTTIDIVDPDATPAEIVAALEEADVPVVVEPIDPTPDADGNVHFGGVTMRPNPGEPLFREGGPQLVIVSPAADSITAAVQSGTTGDLGAVSVTFPGVSAAPFGGTQETAEARIAAYDAEVLARGVRMSWGQPGGDGGWDDLPSISIRDDAPGIEVVLHTIP